MHATAPTTLPDPTPTRAARLAGVSYVAIFVLALFANFFVRVRLVDPDDPAATFAALGRDQTLVRLALLAFLVVFLLDVVVAWALHHVFRPAGAALSSLAAWFRIVYTVFLGVACLFLFAVLQLTGGSAAAASLEQTQRDAHTMLALEAFNATWLIGLTAFGIHLVLVGTIALRTRIAPRPLGAVLAVAGTAYLFDTAAMALLADYGDHAAVFTAIVAVPSVLAELAFTAWLLVTGRPTRAAAPVRLAAA